MTLTLSVLLCIGALASGPAAAAVAQTLERHGTTASERESVALLLSSLNNAARQLCQQQAGQAVVVVTPQTDHRVRHIPTSLRPYETPGRCGTLTAVRPHLLNLPPPAATI